MQYQTIFRVPSVSSFTSGPASRCVLDSKKRQFALDNSPGSRNLVEPGLDLKVPP